MRLTIYTKRTITQKMSSQRSKKPSNILKNSSSSLLFLLPTLLLQSIEQSLITLTGLLVTKKAKSTSIYGSLASKLNLKSTVAISTTKTTKFSISSPRPQTLPRTISKTVLIIKSLLQQKKYSMLQKLFMETLIKLLKLKQNFNTLAKHCINRFTFSTLSSFGLLGT